MAIQCQIDNKDLAGQTQLLGQDRIKTQEYANMFHFSFSLR